MPPKPKILKEQIVEQAFLILKEEGFQAITTRKLAQTLNCSTQPIYHLFTNMEQLKKELYKKACLYFTEQIQNSIRKDGTEFLEMGLAYVKKAKEEKHIFHFICMENNFTLSSMLDLVKHADESKAAQGLSGFKGQGNLSREQLSELFMLVWIFTHGVAAITSGNEVNIKEEELTGLLVKAYKAFALLQSSGENYNK